MPNTRRFPSGLSYGPESKRRGRGIGGEPGTGGVEVEVSESDGGRSKDEDAASGGVTCSEAPCDDGKEAGEGGKEGAYA
jgi:hypothetical protein